MENRNELIKLADEIHNTISEIDNDDENLAVLQNAMEYFCGTWDKCEGYKHAIMLTIDDQIQNHSQEQDIKDYRKLLDILTK